MILVGKLCVRLLTLLGSSATALPGLIILRLYPNFLQDTIGCFPEKIILISGTNGKTTTAHLLVHLLRKSGKRVFHNAAGSNMERGVAAEILKKNNLNFDWYILEVDEGTLPRFMEALCPQTVVLLNIFRDQMDRYGEINGLMKKWSSALQKYPPEKIIYNADDPNVTEVVGKRLKVKGQKYGFSFQHGQACSADRVLCPECNGFLKWQRNDFSCETCGFKKIKPEFILSEKNGELFFQEEKIGEFNFGKYNYYNLAAALAAFGVALTAYSAVGARSSRPLGGIQSLLHGFTPAFGRNEIIKYKNKTFKIFLAKNPAGMDNVLQAINNPNNILMGLNDKIADGEDVSWIYDVDFETHHAVHLLKNLIISGTRAYDLALRLKIAEKLPSNYSIEPNIEKAFEQFLEKVPQSKNSIVILTYTCLMELEKIMYRKKLISKLM